LLGLARQALYHMSHSTRPRKTQVFKGGKGISQHVVPGTHVGDKKEDQRLETEASQDKQAWSTMIFMVPAPQQPLTALPHHHSGKLGPKQVRGQVW
jgi:hypothetical protein